MPFKGIIMAGGWQHPGGKLRELGPASLTEAELLAMLISPGIKGRPAEVIAADCLERFSSLRGLANQPLEKISSGKRDHVGHLLRFRYFPLSGH